MNRIELKTSSLAQTERLELYKGMIRARLACVLFMPRIAHPVAEE
jgi:hypothetical protein